MHRLLDELKPTYGEHPTYQILQRVFSEQFDLQESQVRAKAGKDISPESLRSPDDPEATYRRKGGETYEGYVCNLTETCDESNGTQLIAYLQLAPNLTEDEELLVEALPKLKERTGVNVLYNDAAFCGTDADAILAKHGVQQVPSDLRGRAPVPNRLNLADFGIRCDAKGQPLEVRIAVVL
jgi:hypothetical protein